MEIRSNLKQIAAAKWKNWRTVKKWLSDFEEVWRTNKYWKRELVGYTENDSGKVERKIVIDEEEYEKLLSYKRNNEGLPTDIRWAEDEGV